MDPIVIADDICELLRRGAPVQGQDALHEVEEMILQVQSAGALPGVFAEVIRRGLYEDLRALLCRDGGRGSPAQVALAAARPTYQQKELNAPACRTAAEYVRAGRGAPFDVLIVPGYTPLDASAPLPLAQIPVALERLAAARADLGAKRAPLVLVTGGSVHPAGTPCNEALMMRERLLADGVPPERVLVEPYARHTTTNLRNAGRMMFDLGLWTGLIVTGFDQVVFSQAFYLAHCDISTFSMRCEHDLGYQVGDLEGVAEDRISYRPNKAVQGPDYTDPLDA